MIERQQLRRSSLDDNEDSIIENEEDEGEGNEKDPMHGMQDRPKSSDMDPSMAVDAGVEGDQNDSLSMFRPSLDAL